jgi:hypothetical protein
MKSRIANVVSRVGIEPTIYPANPRKRNTLRTCKPQSANIAWIVVMLVLVCVAQPAVAEPTGLKLPSIVFVAAQGLDAHSTYTAISTGKGREGNPVMNVGTGGQIAIKAAASIGVVYVTHRLHRKHPKLAKGMLWTLSAVTFAVAANNYRIAHR